MASFDIRPTEDELHIWYDFWLFTADLGGLFRLPRDLIRPMIQLIGSGREQGAHRSATLVVRRREHKGKRWLELLWRREGRGSEMCLLEDSLPTLLTLLHPHLP